MTQFRFTLADVLCLPHRHDKTVIILQSNLRFVRSVFKSFVLFPLQKHAYSNILKISPPKKKNLKVSK